MDEHMKALFIGALLGFSIAFSVMVIEINRNWLLVPEWQVRRMPHVVKTLPPVWSTPDKTQSR